MGLQELKKELKALDLSEPKSGEEYAFVCLKFKKESAKAVEELAKDDNLKDDIVREYIVSKFGTIEAEVKAMEDLSVRYRNHLITLRETMKRASEDYEKGLNVLEEELFNKYDKVQKTLFSPMEDRIKTIDSSIDSLTKKIQTTVDKIQSMPSLYQIGQLIEVLKNIEKLSEENKTVLRDVLSTKE